jgi:hypothetical protein
MKIHSDTLTETDLWRELPSGCYIDNLTRHGSRSRDHAFKFNMSATPGPDAHGLDRCYSRNTGIYGGPGSAYEKAATWIEWGDWIVRLFLIDPKAKIGDYDGPDDFIAQTQHLAPFRPKREDATLHATLWREKLIPVAPTDAWTEIPNPYERTYA